jgi:hypothetical protein
VLIVDEAQNLSAETLEELRMLSNVNADKNQVLQVILVGQRELRDTLRQPDLVQFAQRVGVDYHLDALTAEETSDYIQHRCRIAGGKPDLFSDQAREAVFAYSGGVPRLVNLLCDTALVYGYAEQRERIDAKLVNDVARDKQAGGLFSSHGSSSGHPQNSATAAPDPVERATTPVSPSIGSATGHNDRQAAPDTITTPAAAAPPRSPLERPSKLSRGSRSGVLRVAIAGESELLRIYLAKMLGRFGIRVVATLPLNAANLRSLDQNAVDVLLVELDDHLDKLDEAAYELFEKWEKPVLFNDSLATEASLSEPNRLEYGRKLSEKLYSLAPQAPQSVA